MAGRKINERTGCEAKMITEARQRMGYSQQKVSDLIGVNIRQYQRLENGERSFKNTSMKIGLAVCAVLGIDPYVITFGAEFHDLRHSHISLLIDMGFTALAIADRVGHESIDITYRYAHLFPTRQTEMADKLDFERMGT